MEQSKSFDIEQFQQEVLSKIRQIETTVIIYDGHGSPAESPLPPARVRFKNILIATLLTLWFGGLIVLLIFNINLLYSPNPQRPLTEFGKILVFLLVVSFLLTVVTFLAKRHLSKKRLEKIRQREQEAAAKQQLERLFNTQDKLKQAEEIVNSPSIKHLLCQALQTVTNDVFEISKTITPILVGAPIAKMIILPLDTLLFAAIAIVIARSGVSTLCAGYANPKK